MPGLAAAIVEALGSNGSAEARLVLKQILLGKQHSDVDDRALAVAALRTLIDHQDEENQKILLAVLTVPDSIRPAGRGQLTPDQLHEDCLRRCAPSLRRSSGLSWRSVLAVEFLRPPHDSDCIRCCWFLTCANAPAQVELITNGQIDATAMPVLERQLGQTSQQVLDQLLGGRAAIANRSGRSSSPATLDSDSNSPLPHSFDELLQTSEQLWRDDFAKILAGRLDVREDLQSDPALLGLVTSLPKHTLRTALLRRWKTNWIDDAMLAQGSALVSPGMRATRDCWLFCSNCCGNRLWRRCGPFRAA